MSTNNGFLPLPKGFATITIHEAQQPEQWAHNEVVTPISMTTVFKQNAPGQPKSFNYGRLGNPTRDVLQKVIAKLEEGKHAVCLGSGVGAVTILLGLLKTGDHVICIDDVYAGTNSLLREVSEKFGIEVTFSAGDVSSFEKAIKSNTKMIFAESPTNPTITLCDITAVSVIAKKHNIILSIDNTFATPYFQRPLLLGADIVMHSLTKYMNGHSDICMGALVTNNYEIGEKIQKLQKMMGIIPSPFDCYQVLRGLKTLTIRMQQHSKSSLAIAKFLEGHTKVEKVLHPALPSHPQHELAKKQMSGYSGVFAMYIKGDLDATTRFLNSVRYFTLCGSLGDCESLISQPTTMTHMSVPQDQRERIGITDNLIRLSVGLEDTEDLIADLDQALANV